MMSKATKETTETTQIADKKYLVPFILITSLFFLWGFARAILDVLNKHFQNALHISITHSSLILEVLVEYIQNGTSEAPQKEERRNENERDKIFPVGCLICFCLLFC